MLIVLCLCLVVAARAQANPYFPIGTCNTTCSSCSNSNNTNYCLGCEASLTLSSDGTCTTPTGQRISYNEYFQLIGMKNNSTVYNGWTMESKEYGLTTNLSSHIVGCLNNISYFHFDVLGLFNSSTILSTEFTMGYDLESAYILFRGLFFISPITFKATINTDQALIKNVSTGIGSPALSNTNSIIDCSMFTSATSSLYYQKFQSDKILISGSKVYLEITAQYTPTTVTSQEGRWGIRQAVVVLRRCSNCPSPELISTAKMLGAIIGITLATLVLLFLPILILDFVKVKNFIEKLKKKPKPKSEIK